MRFIQLLCSTFEYTKTLFVCYIYRHEYLKSKNILASTEKTIYKLNLGQRKMRFKFNTSIWTIWSLIVAQKEIQVFCLLNVWWYICSCNFLRECIMCSAINISLKGCTFYLNTALCYAYKNFCKLQSSIREILTCYKLKKTIYFYVWPTRTTSHSQCSEMRWLFTLLWRLFQTMNQKGIWAGPDTRRMQSSESVSPPTEDSIGFPTVLTPEN